MQLMTKRCIQRLKHSIPIKWFKFFNTRECSINNVIQLVQCHVRSHCHLNVKELFISGSIHIISKCYHQLFSGFYTVHRGTPRAAMTSDGGRGTLPSKYPHNHISNELLSFSLHLSLTTNIKFTLRRINIHLVIST